MENNYEYKLPSKDMSLFNEDENYTYKIKWTKNYFEDFASMSESYYKCATAVLTFAQSDLSISQNKDMVPLAGFFLARNSLELALKALILRNCNKKELPDIGKTHGLQQLFNDCLKQGELSALSSSEKDWLKSFLGSIDTYDNQSDLFRFPFKKCFLNEYHNEFLDTEIIFECIIQAYSILKKCINKNSDIQDFTFDSTLPRTLFVKACDGRTALYIWQEPSYEVTYDDTGRHISAIGATPSGGFFVKIKGYKATCLNLFSNDLPLSEKFFPLMYSLRILLELCLKHICEEYNRKFHQLASKKCGHKLKKMWYNVKEISANLNSDHISQEDSITNEECERLINEIIKIDPYGNSFRYPVTNKLQYFNDGKSYSLKNYFECTMSIVNLAECMDYQMQAILSTPSPSPTRH